MEEPGWNTCGRSSGKGAVGIRSTEFELSKKVDKEKLHLPQLPGGILVGIIYRLVILIIKVGSLKFYEESWSK